MASRGPSTLFSRILLIVGGLLVIGLSYWFIQTSLAPVPVPVVPPSPSSVRFDPTLDVSKDPVFFGLRPLGPDLAQPSSIGRPNPFTPVIPAPPAATSTTSTVGTTATTSGSVAPEEVGSSTTPTP